MIWDFAEANPLSDAGGGFGITPRSIEKVLRKLPQESSVGKATQEDATILSPGERSHIVSTDPPYYNNIGYADLSDYFYVWLRRSLRDVFPGMFGSMLVPKAEELIAAPYRHGGSEKAEQFFMEGMSQALKRFVERSHLAFPVTIYYAFKQAETKNGATASTGWETFLEAVIRAGFAITGTWPMRTELIGNLKKQINALASSIILVCRPRLQEVPTVSQRTFLRELAETMPEALEAMIGGTEGASPIAPVDLAQAAIGPGMAVYSQYHAVLKADGSRMPVREALARINHEVDRYFASAEGHMDADTRFCIDWFQQYDFKPGPFGEADVLARAKGTSVEGVALAGVVQSGGGRVSLLKVTEYPENWDPRTDRRTPVWEACHQLAHALQKSEADAGALLAKMPAKQEPVRQLAYRLYTLCERKGWAEEARAYNTLIGSWHGIVEQSRMFSSVGHRQLKLPYDEQSRIAEHSSSQADLFD